MYFNLRLSLWGREVVFDRPISKHDDDDDDNKMIAK